MKQIQILYDDKNSIQKLLLQLLCETHVNYISESKEYINIRNAIIGGAFTSKIKTNTVEKKTYVDKNIQDLNLSLIDNWKNLSKEMEHLNFYVKDEPFYCYRVIDNKSIINTDIGSTININPIPVSATFDIDMANKWSANKDNFSILKIGLEPYLNFTIFDKLYERDSEIILPAGHVVIENKYVQNNVDVYVCSYHIVNYKIVKCSENGFCKCSESKFCIFTEREIENMSRMEIKFTGERKRFISRKK